MTDFTIKTDPNTPTMSDPIAFFITWPTYGTWLPGDQRGWVEYHHGWQLPEPSLQLDCASRMTEQACRLSPREREIVEAQVYETCDHRGWQVYAARCRSNHMHIVIGAHNTNPKKIRRDIKAWCTRRLKEKSNPARVNWWAERGSIRYVWNTDSLTTVIEYVTEAQDRKHLEIRLPNPKRQQGTQPTSQISVTHPSLTHLGYEIDRRSQPEPSARDSAKNSADSL